MLSSLKKWEELKEIAPDNIMAVFMDLMMHTKFGQEDEAIEDFKKVLSHIGMSDLDNFVDGTYKNSNFETTVRTVADSLEIRSRTTFVAPSIMMRFYGNLLHDREKFFHYMQRMYETNDPDLGYLGIKHPSDPLQKDPRYIAIMEKIGLW